MRTEQTHGGFRSRILLKIKWDAELAKLLLLVLQIFISKLVESAVLFERDQKGIHLCFESLLVSPNSDSPLFLLKRLENGFSAVLMLLPMLEDGYLVINECLGFILDDFQNTRVFLFE